MSWLPEFTSKNVRINKPVLIEGLPGIGNVGKVTVDFLIDVLKAKKILHFKSNDYPHTVFVNEQNLVELPTIEVYWKQHNNSDILLLAGDVQPLNEHSCYEFCNTVLDVMQQFKAKSVVTLGGIALRHVPKHPQVFCTGTTTDIISYYCQGTQINQKLYGVVGPIIGVSAVLLGLAGQRNIPAVSLLAETYGHPLYLGINGAREIITILNKKLRLNLDMQKLDKRISELDKEFSQRTKEVNALHAQQAFARLRGKIGKDVSYIG